MNAEDAGKAEIELLAVSPTGQNIPVQAIQQSDGQIIIEFIPNTPGHYKLHVLYGGEQINGSPLTFAVNGLDAALQSDNQYISNGNGLEIAHRGKETFFTVYSPTTPVVQIERFDEQQSERIEPKIKSLGNNEWRIAYTILSVGKYDIRASSNRGPLQGSPWTVACVDPNKIIPIGGWSALLDEEGRLILPARIVFETQQAGPGELMCSVDGRVLGK